MHHATRRVACREQVLHDFLLPVDRHAASAGQLGEGHGVRLSAKPELDPVVAQALTRQPLAQSGRVHEVHAALFQHPRSHPVHHVLLAPPLEDDRLHPLEVQEVREHQARGTAADDDDLSRGESGSRLPAPASR